MFIEAIQIVAILLIRANTECIYSALILTCKFLCRFMYCVNLFIYSCRR